MSYTGWDHRYLRLVESQPLRRRRLSPAARRRQRLRGFCRLLFLVGILVVIVWTTTRVADATPDAAAFRGKVYIVHSGDTLWGVAVQNYGQQFDPRRVEYEIQRSNGLDGPQLREGQRLVLPYLE